MPNTPPSGSPSPPPTRQPEQRVLARAVGVWWVRRLLEAARARRAARRAREQDDAGRAAPVVR